RATDSRRRGHTSRRGRRHAEGCRRRGGRPSRGGRSGVARGHGKPQGARRVCGAIHRPILPRTRARVLLLREPVQQASRLRVQLQAVLLRRPAAVLEERVLHALRAQRDGHHGEAGQRSQHHPLLRLLRRRHAGAPAARVDRRVQANHGYRQRGDQSLRRPREGPVAVRPERRGRVHLRHVLVPVLRHREGADGDSAQGTRGGRGGSRDLSTPSTAARHADEEVGSRRDDGGEEAAKVRRHQGEGGPDAVAGAGRAVNGGWRTRRWREGPADDDLSRL
ncbi:predicted protein, partial [Micromonas commoda]